MATAKKLDEMITGLEAELVTLAKSVKDTLSKAHPGEDTVSEAPANDSATMPEGSASGGGASAPGADAGAPPAPGMDAGGGGDAMPSHEEIVEALRQLPPEELAAYKAAIDEVVASQGGASAPEASGSAGGPPPEMSMGMGKSESLAKAERMMADQGMQIAELRKSLGDLQKSLVDTKSQLKASEDARTEANQAIEKFLSAPNRRALTAPPRDVQKSEGEAENLSDLSKAEVSQRLRQVVRSKGGVNASDKAAIDDYLFNGASVDRVKHLLA
jgi:hypothetical protein